ncbi:MAG: metallophosphatase domain-containing protein [Paludibacter sp.]
MKILHLSDTHSKHLLIKNLPKADIIVHSGDFTENGTESEVIDFINWFCNLDYHYKIFVAGNHDLCLDGERIEGLPENCHYLYNSGIEILGVSFWGIPYFVSTEKSGETATNLLKIPDKLNVFISHRPPYGILDSEENYHFGCIQLLEFVQSKRPQYHLFGHVHADYGIIKSYFTTFVNASLISKNNIRNKPILIEII